MMTQSIHSILVILPDITKSQCIHVILEYLSNRIDLPMDPQFLQIDQRSKEIRVFMVNKQTQAQPEWRKVVLADSCNYLQDKSKFDTIDVFANQSLKIITTSEFGGRYFLCGAQRISSIRGKSPCYEYKQSMIIKRADMKNIRMYFSLVCLTKYDKLFDYSYQRDTSDGLDFGNSPRNETDYIVARNCYYQNRVKHQYLYAIGGKGINVVMKSIEKYDIERDEWSELKIQLNNERAFASALSFANRYIYIIGGTTNTDCLEIIDTDKENETLRCTLVLLNLNSYQPWFKEILLPIDSEGIIKFCGLENINAQLELDSNQGDQFENYTENDNENYNEIDNINMVGGDYADEDEEDKYEIEQQSENEDDVANEDVDEQYSAEGSKKSLNESQSEDDSLHSMNQNSKKIVEQFMIIGNYYKTNQIKQLYRFNIRDSSVHQIDVDNNQNDDFSVNSSSMRINSNLQMPFVFDAFFHQYYLKSKQDENSYYVMGENKIHRINFVDKSWDTIASGSCEPRNQC
ncbi:kelch motif family protein [Stylonychia lemnae]|uniref:Kelch motif family protein n=1 Tax=Stylonychia lemnae TaxID=5949 RepID=A0A077ZYR0_STYLE|nr:kelch motif family protein [Stylonychia lemnae]|eukprot:CDW74752.1 kelch motif family protein [Stylonychia lemnae]